MTDAHQLGKRLRPAVGLVLAAGLVLAGGAAFAQSNLETNAAIRFNFETPGAGNLAMGGAFLALANDATAAFTNPAGLPHLARAEVHLELRSFRYTHVFTDHGRLEGPPTGIGLDTISGLVDGEATDTTAGLSFLSYVHLHKDWAIALFRHELANFEASFRTQGAFLQQARSRSLLGIPGEPDGRLASLDNRMDVEIVNHGLSLAYRVRPRFSLGVTVSTYDFFLASRADRFTPPLFEAADFQPANVVNTQTQRGEDDAWGVSAGFLWQSPGERWSVGGVFRQGPSFDLVTESVRGSGSLLDFHESSARARFHVPDVAGIGVAFQPSDSWMITFDVDHVGYGETTRGLVDIFDLGSFFSDLAGLGLDDLEHRFKVDDATELHLGLEVTLRGTWALRGGVWYEPDHSLFFDGDNPSFGAIFRKRGGELHVSAGLGIYRRRFDVHAAVDISDRVSTSSLSLVVRPRP